MKHSITLSAAILIALALLLMAASVAQASQAPKSSPTPESKSIQVRKQEDVHAHDQHEPPYPSPLEIKRPRPPLSSAGEQGNQQKDIEGRLTLFTGLLVIVGALQFAAACFQYRAAKQSAKATQSSASAAQSQLELAQNTSEQSLVIAKESIEAARQSADAARQNVEVGKLWLQVDRPYMLVEECSLSGMPDAGPVPCGLNFSEQIAASISLRNFGKGPAIIEDICGRFVLMTVLPAARDFTDCHEMIAPKVAMRSGEELKTLAPWLDCLTVLDSQAKCDALMLGMKKLLFYGRIRYRDVFEEQYETAFLWEYSRFTITFFDKGFFSRGPESHNYRT
jgi:hypothetical protein